MSAIRKGGVAVITGAAGGIGYALAEQALRSGMNVVISDIREDALEAARARLAGQGADVLAVGGDDHEHDRHDHEADPGREVEEGQPAQGQHEQDLLRRVGDRGQGVGGEDGQGDALGQERGVQFVAALGPAQQ